MSDTTIDTILLRAGVPKGIHRIALDIEVGADRYSPENINKLSKIDTFTEAKSALYDLILKEVVGEDSKVYRPDDLHKLSPEMQKAITMTITSDNRLRATQRNKLADVFGVSDA